MIYGGHELKNFSEDEFPNCELEYAEPNLLYRLQRQRDVFGAGIYPSKAPGALARFKPKGMTSKHYAEKPADIPGWEYTLKKSTAIDFFTELPPFEAYCKIISSELWDGVGIYFDTERDGKPDVLYHTDYGRDDKAFWFRNAVGVYITQNTDVAFWGKLQAAFLDFY